MGRFQLPKGEAVRCGDQHLPPSLEDLGELPQDQKGRSRKGQGTPEVVSPGPTDRPLQVCYCSLGNSSTAGCPHSMRKCDGFVSNTWKNPQARNLHFDVHLVSRCPWC